MTRLIDRDIDEDRITGSEGLIDAKVIRAFHELGGDFGDAVPYALMEARKSFERDAEKTAAGHGLNRKRMIACEVLVQRLVAHIERSTYEKGSESAGSYHMCFDEKVSTIRERRRCRNPDFSVGSGHRPELRTSASIDRGKKGTQAIWDGSLVQQYSPQGYTYFVSV